MKTFNELKRKPYMLLVLLASSVFLTSQLSAQQVEVQGKLKVNEMIVDDTQENLVIKNTDGTLGTRSVASLPPPPPPIDTTRNLASDFELAKHLCDCPNLPPFMIRKLLESGYTQGDLIGSGIPEQDVVDALRFGYITDLRDNNSYKTVTIGTQTWMAENLNIGIMINSTTGGDDSNGEQTGNNTIEKYCYENDIANCATYGGLYQWNEMMGYATIEGAQGICPTGWHLPTDSEWKTLEEHLGMCSGTGIGCSGDTDYRGTDQGCQLAGNELLWSNGPLDQNGLFGSSGFAALPGGSRFTDGSFDGQSTESYFWSSTKSGIKAWFRYMLFVYEQVYRWAPERSNGYSVRCVQD